MSRKQAAGSKTGVTTAVFLDGKVYIRHDDGSLVLAEGKTDWAALDALTDDDLTAAAEADPDARPMTDEEWQRATTVPIET